MAGEGKDGIEVKQTRSLFLGPAASSAKARPSSQASPVPPPVRKLGQVERETPSGQAAAGRGPFKEERGRGPGEGRVRGRISAARRRRPGSRIWSARRRRGRRGRRGGAFLGLGPSSLPAAASRLRLRLRLALPRPQPGRVATSGRSPGTRSPGTRSPASGRLGTRMKDRLEQLKAVSPAAPGTRRAGGSGAGAEREMGFLSLPKSRREGAGPALPRVPAASRAGSAPSPPHRGHMPVIHRWAEISLDASSLPSLLHPQAGQRQSRAGNRGGRLGPEGPV